MMKTNRFTPTLWALAALALIGSTVSTGVSANIITMIGYQGGGPDQVECTGGGGCLGFIGTYPGGPIDTSSSLANAYPQAGNPESEKDRLNELLLLFAPPRATVNYFGDPDSGAAGFGFTTDRQYFAIKQARDLFFFENKSGGELTVALTQGTAEYSHWTEFGPVAVPVPAAIWLFGTALIGFIGFSRRTKV